MNASGPTLEKSKPDSAPSAFMAAMAGMPSDGVDVEVVDEGLPYVAF